MSAGGTSGTTEALIHATLDAHKAAGTRPTSHARTATTDPEHRAHAIIARITLERATEPHYLSPVAKPV